MKIRLRYNDGGFLVAVACGILVLFVGGCVYYHLHRQARRVNGPPTAPQPTNRLDFPGPEATNDIKAGSWRDLALNFEWWEPSVVLASAPEPLPEMAVCASLDSNGIAVMTISRASQIGMRPRLFSSLVPMDEYGLPDLSWSMGEMPKGPYVPVVLERSTNLVGWVSVIQWELRCGLTNVWSETASDHAFYRIGVLP
jgi:hypothetical protein